MNGDGIATPPRPVPQRLVIVASTSVAFDSRSHRIARTLAGRGHEVTIVGRWEPGLPYDERTADGYRILRLEVDPLAAIPGSAIRNCVRRLLRRPAVDGGAVPASAAATGTANRGRRSRSGLSHLDALLRLLRIGLTVRAQVVASRRAAPPADLYHGMAYMGLPVALDLGRRARVPVVYDARDIYLEARNLARMPAPVRTVFGWLERRWTRRATRVVTVNEAYATELEMRLGVERPLVVMNCPGRSEVRNHRRRRFHERLGLPPTSQVLLYHGGLTADRGIEELLAALPSIRPSAHLVLMGYGPLRDVFIARAQDDPAVRGRVHILDAVPPTELLDWVAAADVAVMPIQPTTLNHRLTTPNKLFEAMAAGVPLVASNLPGMAAIVAATGCGRLCDPTDIADLARAIEAILTADPIELEEYRRRGREAVRGHYNWERQVAGLLAEYERLTGRPW